MNDTDINNIKKNTRWGFIWTIFEKVSVQSVSFVISIILARLLLPQDYGMVSMVLIYINIANSFVVNGFGNVLVKKNDITDNDITLALVVNVIFGIILYLVLYFIAPVIVLELENKNILISVINILGIRVIIGSINSIQQSIAWKRMEYKKTFYSTFVGVIISGGCGVIMAYKGYGIWSLVVQDLLNVIINTILLSTFIHWKISFSFKSNCFRRICIPGFQYMIIGVLNSVYGNINNFIISKKFGAEGLAYYSKANSFPSIISGTISAASAKVLFPSMALLENNLIEIKKMLRTTVQLATYCLFPMIVGIAAISDELIPILLTNKWVELVPFLKLICIMYIFQPFQVYSIQTLMAVTNGGYYMILEITKKILSTVILVSSFFICETMVGMILFMLISQIFSALICSVAVKRKVNYTYKEQLIDCVNCLSPSIIMYMGICLISIIPINSICAMLIIKIAFGLIFMIIFTLLFHEAIIKQIRLLFIKKM